jgi:hypothetical protein
MLAFSWDLPRVSSGALRRESVGDGLMFATGYILPLVMIAMTPTIMVESSRWLVLKKRYQSSQRVLNKLYLKETTEEAIQSILQDIQEDMERERQLQQAGNTGLGWLFQKKPRAIRKILQLMGLGIAISHKICGIDAIQYYLVFVLGASGISSRGVQAQYLIALGGLKFACLFAASALVENLGRRPLLLMSVAGMILFGAGQFGRYDQQYQ